MRSTYIIAVFSTADALASPSGSNLDFSGDDHGSKQSPFKIRTIMDIWSMGCVILECATGRKPWSNLDNEWCEHSESNVLALTTAVRAIMFHIGVATQHPPLPDKHELSDVGIAFIQDCLDIDAIRRPSAQEMMQHPWMLQFMDTLEKLR